MYLRIRRNMQNNIKMCKVNSKLDKASHSRSSLGDLASLVAAARAWNSLSSTVTTSVNPAFRRALKTSGGSRIFERGWRVSSSVGAIKPRIEAP